MTLFFDFELIDLHFGGIGLGLSFVEKFEGIFGFGGQGWFVMAVEELLLSGSALVVAC
jgi:hypothetical protein